MRDGERRPELRNVMEPLYGMLLGCPQDSGSATPTACSASQRFGAGSSRQPMLATAPWIPDARKVLEQEVVARQTQGAAPTLPPGSPRIGVALVFCEKPISFIDEVGCNGVVYHLYSKCGVTRARAEAMAPKSAACFASFSEVPVTLETELAWPKHHAQYLQHIITRYDRLEPYTIFVKANLEKRRLSLGEMVNIIDDKHWGFISFGNPKVHAARVADTPARLLSSSLTAQTLRSYAGKLSQFAEFCHDSENISLLEATTATVVRYAAWIGERGHIGAKSLQPYLSAINTFFELHNLDPIAKGSLHLTAASRGLMLRQRRLEAAPLREGRAAVVELLLRGVEGGPAADISCTDKNGRTALHCAAQGGHAGVVELLLRGVEGGPAADISCKDVDGMTALHHAAQGGCAEVVDMLLGVEGGTAADISCTDEMLGMTALHWAASGGHAAVVELLLKGVEGGPAADISCTDKNGMTALHCAAQEGHAEVVELLLRGVEGGPAADISAAWPKVGCNGVVYHMYSKCGVTRARAEAMAPKSAACFASFSEVPVTLETELAWPKHHAQYLQHIITRYDRLEPYTIFVKANLEKRRLSLGEMVNIIDDKHWGFISFGNPKIKVNMTSFPETGHVGVWQREICALYRRYTGADPCQMDEAYMNEIGFKPYFYNTRSMSLPMTEYQWFREYIMSITFEKRVKRRYVPERIWQAMLGCPSELKTRDIIGCSPTKWHPSGLAVEPPGVMLADGLVTWPQIPVQEFDPDLPYPSFFRKHNTPRVTFVGKPPTNLPDCLDKSLTGRLMV
eukprot:jgi/Tetstr1/446225/TSEL_033769.t1